jgi:NifB/MoaA-like Fe-S oxidoreductase
MQRNLRARLGTTFAFLGDEIYLSAGQKLPGRTHYGDYPQIEDGIGMVRSFQNEFAGLLRTLARRGMKHADDLDGTIITGTLFAPALKPLIAELNERFGTRLRVEGIENNYFGGDVSVAGLLTGGDFLAARERIQGKFAIIPRTTLKSDEEIMLDGMKLDQLQEALGIRVYPCDFKAFAQFLLN